MLPSEYENEAPHSEVSTTKHVLKQKHVDKSKEINSYIKSKEHEYVNTQKST